jgi:hypothetical protein
MEVAFMKVVAKGFALLAGLSLLLACERAYAITVTGVEVDIGSTVFTNWNGAGINQLGASGTTITAGQDLILTQNPTTPGNFNFVQAMFYVPVRFLRVLRRLSR